MRRSLMLVCLCLTVAPTMASGQQEAIVGNVHIAAKLDYIRFTGSQIDNDIIDDGLYLGLEAFWHFKPQWYLGGEIGEGTNPDLLSFDSLYIYPIEFNLKRVMPLSSSMYWAVGAGPSLNYVEVKETDFFFGEGVDAEAWLLGGQVFADLGFTFSRFLAGINLKYQFTSELEEAGGPFSNLRFGIQFGRILGSE